MLCYAHEIFPLEEAPFATDGCEKCEKEASLRKVRVSLRRGTMVLKKNIKERLNGICDKHFPL